MTIDPRRLAALRTWRSDSQLTICRFTPDSRRIVAGGHDGRLQLLAVEGDERSDFEAHRGWIEGLRWLPDGSRLISADSWGEVAAWGWDGGRFEAKPVWRIADACRSWLRDLAVAPDGRWFATCGNEPVVRVFSTGDGKLARELRGHEQPVMSVAFSPDGKALTSGDLHGVVRHWNLDDGQCVRQLDAKRLFKTYQHYRQGGVRSMTFDPEGATLYCAGFEGVNANQAQGAPLVLALDWMSGEMRTTLTPEPTLNGPVMDVAWHPQGYLLAAGSSEGGGELWTWPKGESKNVHHLKHATSFRRLAISPDGEKLAAPVFGDLDGQRGGNGRRLTKDGQYPDFGGSLVLLHWPAVST